MSLLQGGLSIVRYLVLGPVPSDDELMQGLQQDCFRPFQDGLEEERVGWVDWRRLTCTPPEVEFVRLDRHAVFSLRVDVRRVPPDLLKAHVDERIARLMTEKDLAFVGKEARISLQDEVKAELLKKVLPSPKAYEVVWDLKGGTIMTTAASAKVQGHLTTLFVKSFGCELQPMAPLLLASYYNVPVDSLMALDPLDFSVEEDENGGEQ